MRRCKFCGAEIDWITNLEGKSVPVDPDPVCVIEDGGPEEFLDDMGATVTGRQAAPEEERRDLTVGVDPQWRACPVLTVAFVPHRRTCPALRGPVRRRGAT